jgi:hypothetical protein
MNAYLYKGAILAVVVVVLLLLLWGSPDVSPSDAPAASETGRACYERILQAQAEMIQAHRQLQTIGAEQTAREKELTNLTAVHELNEGIIAGLQSGS